MYIHQLFNGVQVVPVPVALHVVKPGKALMLPSVTQSIEPVGKLVVLVCIQLPVGPLVVVQPTV